MTTEFLTTAARSGANQWGCILPEILLAALALLLLVFEIVFPPRLKRRIPLISLVAQGAILALTLGIALGDNKAADLRFYAMLASTPAAQFMRVYFVAVSILVHALAMITLARQRVPRAEFFHIVLVVTAAMMLLAQAANFVMLFVALETVAVGFYILVSYYRTQPLSLEAGLKYLVLGALSSAFLLFGIVLLYGVSGAHTLGANAPQPVVNDPLSYYRVFAALHADVNPFAGALGMLLVLGGIAFKIGLVPFQIWIADVYQGAPAPVTAFLSVGSKAAGFAMLVEILSFVAGGTQDIVEPFLIVLAAATLLFGNLAALLQHNIKRLMGQSGVSHAGFMMLAVVAALHDKDNVRTPLFAYLIAYALATIAVFGVMALVAPADDTGHEMADYRQLGRRSPFLAAVLVIALGSLAGIPPLFGFTAKFLVLVNTLRAGLYPLLAVAIIAVTISIYYYFSWMRAALFNDPHPAAPQNEPTPGEAAAARATPAPAPAPLARAIPIPRAMTALLALLTAATLLLGFWPAPIMRLLAALHLA